MHSVIIGQSYTHTEEYVHRFRDGSRPKSARLSDGRLPNVVSKLSNEKGWVGIVQHFDCVWLLQTIHARVTLFAISIVRGCVASLTGCTICTLFDEVCRLGLLDVCCGLGCL